MTETKAEMTKLKSKPTANPNSKLDGKPKANKKSKTISNKGKEAAQEDDSDDTAARLWELEACPSRKPI
ncbi:hypothetical protein EG329_001823 [Mollisiaceae sp. DMI_Dod_QoI]|nr:hypothetical protein EG329_001823 [Helotiales sp. DMI_Dod_QoI]